MLSLTRKQRLWPSVPDLDMAWMNEIQSAHIRFAVANLAIRHSSRRSKATSKYDEDSDGSRLSPQCVWVILFQEGAQLVEFVGVAHFVPVEDGGLLFVEVFA